MKKQKIHNLSLNKKTVSNFEIKNIKGGTIPTMFPCWSIHWCPTLKCTKGPNCTSVP